MIKYSQIKEVFKSLNINIYEFKMGVFDTVESTPFAVYAVVGIESFFADNVVYFKNKRVQFEVVTDFYDKAMLDAVDKIFFDNSTPYTLEQEFDDELRTLSNIFTFSVIDG